MQKILLITLLLLTATIQIHAENMLKDPLFELGATGYIVGDRGNAGEFTITKAPDGKGNAVNIKAVSGQLVALYLPEIFYRPNTEYELSFNARCGKGELPLIVSEYVTKQNGSHGTFFPTVTTEWKRYTFHFNTDDLPKWGTPRFDSNDMERMGGFRIVKNNNYEHEDTELSISDLYFGPAEKRTSNTASTLGAFITDDNKSVYSKGEKINLPIILLNKTNQAQDIKITWQLILDNGRKIIAVKQFPLQLAPGKNSKELNITLPQINGSMTLVAKTDAGDFINCARLAISPKVRAKVGELPVDIGINSPVTNQYLNNLTQTELDFIADAGISFIRPWDNGNPFSWNKLEPGPNNFYWEKTDELVNLAGKAGIEILPVLGGMFFVYPDYNPKEPSSHAAPEWVYKTGETVSCPANMPQFTSKGRKTILPKIENWNNMIRSVVERYKGKIKYYEIMNEPNLCLTAEQYMVYLKNAGRIIREIDPNAKIIGICSTGDYNGHIVEYVNEVLKLGGAEYFDDISFHAYNCIYEDSKNSGEAVLSAFYKNLKEHKLKNVRLWNTELYYLNPRVTGGSDHMRGPVFHAGYLARRYLLDAANGTKASILVPGGSFCGNSFNANYANVRSGSFFSKKLFANDRYIVNAVFADTLKGTHYTGGDEFKNKIKVYKFASPDKAVTALFSLNLFTENETPAPVTAPPAGITVIDVQGNPIEVKDGKLQFKLSPLPVYLIADNQQAIDKYLENFSKLERQEKAS